MDLIHHKVVLLHLFHILCLNRLVISLFLIILLKAIKAIHDFQLPFLVFIVSQVFPLKLIIIQLLHLQGRSMSMLLIKGDFLHRCLMVNFIENQFLSHILRKSRGVAFVKVAWPRSQRYFDQGEFCEGVPTSFDHHFDMYYSCA